MSAHTQPIYEIGFRGSTLRIGERLPSAQEVDCYADCVDLAVTDVDNTLTYRHGGPVSVEAERFAQDVAKRGMQLAIVSNNPDEQYVQGVARALGVDSELTLSPHVLMDQKPSPAMVRRVMQAAGVIDGSRVVGVGDGLTDILAYWAAEIEQYRLVVTDPNEANGYILRPEFRRAVHVVGRLVLPAMVRAGWAEKHWP